MRTDAIIEYVHRLIAATAAGVLFLVEMVIGALMLMWGFTASLLVMYVATAAALWALLVVLAVSSGLLSRATAS
jgi:hypothetical protein